MNLQETRLTFQGDDPILHRKLFLNGILIHLYLMSAVNGYNGMAIISRYPLNVEKVSDRIMKANLLLENIFLFFWRIFFFFGYWRIPRHSCSMCTPPLQQLTHRSKVPLMKICLMPGMMIKAL